MDSASAMYRPLKKVFFVTMLTIYLVSAALWTWPEEAQRPEWFSTVKEKWIRPYFKALNLYQSWAMFAPDPMRFERKMDALITRQDGTLTIWPMPSYKTGFIVDRIRGEQNRKWSLDHIRIDKNEKFWPPLIRYLKAHFDQLEPTNPVYEIKLRRQWKRDIPVPYYEEFWSSSDQTAPKSFFNPSHFQNFFIFHQRVFPVSDPLGSPASSK